MTKSIILRADLCIQYHHILRVTIPGLKEMSQWLLIRVDWRQEFIQIEAVGFQNPRLPGQELKVDELTSS